MSEKKKRVREAFRNAVFGRDSHKCRVCGNPPPLDAHHITNREAMPNGGYVKENGISLCNACHEKAELYYSLGEAYPDMHPEDLYKMIDSCYDAAYKASERLK